MITLKESILGRTADNVSSAKKDIENLKYFGTNFKVDSALVFIKPIDVAAMSLRALKKYTVGNGFFTEEDEEFNYYAKDKAIHLCKYLYSIDLNKLGMDADEIMSSMDSMKKFVSALEEQMVKDGVFKKGVYHISTGSTERFIKDGYLLLSFTRYDKWANFSLGFYTREQ